MSGQRLLCCLLVLALSVFSVGCWDTKEIEQMVYVNAIGIDFKEGQYSIYAQAISFSNLAKKEAGGQQSPDQIWVGRGFGRTIDSATDNLYPSSQTQVSWGHMKAVILSDSALKRGAYHEMLDAFARFGEIRSELYIFATQEPLVDLLTAHPILNLSSLFTQMVNPESNYQQFSIISPVSMREFNAYLREPSRTLICPYLSVTPKRWSVNKKYFSVMQISGAAMIKNGKYKGNLFGDEMRGLHWTQKKVGRAVLYVYEQDHPIATINFEHPKSKIKVHSDGNTPRFSIEIKASGAVNEMMQPRSEKDLTKQSEQQIADHVRKTYQAALKKGADVLQLEAALYQKDPKLWRSLNKKGPILDEQSLQSIDVKVNLASSGALKLLK